MPGPTSCMWRRVLWSPPRSFRATVRFILLRTSLPRKLAWPGLPPVPRATGLVKRGSLFPDECPPPLSLPESITPGARRYRLTPWKERRGATDRVFRKGKEGRAVIHKVLSHPDSGDRQEEVEGCLGPSHAHRPSAESQHSSHHWAWGPLGEGCSWPALTPEWHGGGGRQQALVDVEGSLQSPTWPKAALCWGRGEPHSSAPAHEEHPASTHSQRAALGKRRLGEADPSWARPSRAVRQRLPPPPRALGQQGLPQQSSLQLLPSPDDRQSGGRFAFGARSRGKESPAGAVGTLLTERTRPACWLLAPSTAWSD